MKVTYKDTYARHNDILQDLKDINFFRCTVSVMEFEQGENKEEATNGEPKKIIRERGRRIKVTSLRLRLQGAAEFVAFCLLFVIEKLRRIHSNPGDGQRLDRCGQVSGPRRNHPLLVSQSNLSLVRFFGLGHTWTCFLFLGRTRI